MRRVKHNVTFKKKEEPVDEPEDNEDITSEGDTPDPDPKPTPLDDIPEGQQEQVRRIRAGWTGEEEEEKPTLKPAKDLKEDVPAKAPYAITSEGEEQQGTVKETEEQQEDMEKKYWQELETAEEEGRVADFEKVGGANFMTELMAIESDNIMNDFVIMHYESKADVIRNDEFSKLETDMSLGTREERKLYGHILKDEAVWSLKGKRENVKKLRNSKGRIIPTKRGLNFSNVDGNSNLLVENEGGSWHQLTLNEELKLTTTYGDEDADTVLNTPQTPLEELGRAVYERAKPASKFGKEYIRPRTDHGIPDTPTSSEAAIESKLPDEVEDEFIIDLGVTFDKSELGKALLAGSKFHRDEANNIINTPAEGAVDIYNIVKETAIRTQQGIVGRDYNDLKPFLNEEGTENSWNIEPPMANFTHPINDIRAHVVNELMDSLSSDELLKLTQSDPNTQPTRNTEYIRGKEEYGGIIQDHPVINKIVEDALKKQGIDPYKEQFFNQELMENVMDNIQTERGVGGGRLEDELGYTYEDVINRNVKFVRMTVADFQDLHDPQPINFKDGSTNEATVEYFKDKIRRGLLMPTVNLVHDVVTNNYIKHQGRHRAEAARQMGITHIPVVIRLSTNSTSRYGKRIAAQADIYLEGEDSDAPLPKTMNELIKFPTLLRRFLGNTHDRSSREFFGAGEMDNYAHTEHGAGRPSEWDRRQQNFEEVIFLTHVEQVHTNAQRVAGFRSKFRLTNMLDEHMQNYGGSFENQASAIRGIQIIPNLFDEDNLFTQSDITILDTQTNNMEMHGNWIKASEKFYKLLDNNPKIKDAFEEAEELVNSQLNRPNARDFNRGAFRIAVRSMPKIEMGRNTKKKKILQPLVSGRRGRGVFNFISMSISPSAAMNETQPFHTAGGIAMEFNLSLLKVKANEMLRKTDPTAKVKLVEYTVYPVETVGESPDPNMWKIETIDSKMPISFAHELEFRVPINTGIEDAVEGMIVDAGSYANLQRLFDSYGMKAEGRLYKKYLSEHMASHERSEIIDFFLGGKNGEYKVPYGNAIESKTSILNKLDRIISKYANLTSTTSTGEWGDWDHENMEEGKRPKIRYKFERYKQMDHSVIRDNMNDGRQEIEYKTAFDIAMGHDADSTYTATAEQKITDYVSTMRDKLTPSYSDIADIKKQYEKIEEQLWAQIQYWEKVNDRKSGVRSIFLGGSTGKNTNLTGSSDLDIFIEFDYPFNQKYIDNFVLELGDARLLPMTSGAEDNYTEKYGVEGIDDDGTKFPHRYPEGHIKYYPTGAINSKYLEVQLLGVSHVTEEQIARGRNGTKDADGNMITDGMKTGNDRSIMHTKVIKPLLFGREHEVRVLKNWLKENKIYDSSGKERGLSGYSSELLIIHLGSFKKVLEYFANFKPYSKLGNTDRDFDSMFVLVDMIDKNRNLGAAFSDPEGADHIKKNLKLARLIKASKFMLEHGRAPKLQRTKRESVHVEFSMPTEDENATYQQLYSIAGKIYNALKREKYGVDSAVEIISEGFEIELPRIDIDVTKGGGKSEIVTMYFGFKTDPRTEVDRKTILEQSHLEQGGASPNSSHMMRPEWFWEEGIPTNQPQDRIDKWKKAAKIRLNNVTGFLVPDFKTEVDEKGVERWYIHMHNPRPWVGDWLRQQINSDKLGLGKFNKLMKNKEWEYTPKHGDRYIKDNHKTFENVTGSKKEGMWKDLD